MIKENTRPNDTIVAVSTPVGRGGIAVVRMSGEPLKIALSMFECAQIKKESPVPNYMYFGTINADGFKDRGYMVYFAAPKSYTGEDIVEFHCHGGVRIVQGIVAECVNRGARPADRGEFTKRAFLNGKMNLSDAEGVIDMINADSRSSVKVAYRLMNGELSKDVQKAQAELLEVITDMEAMLDYPDEMEDEVLPEAHGRIEDIAQKLNVKLKGQTYGKMAKNGIDVVIAGKTNAGKSSLLNKILSKDRAIVSATEGTTRDSISESIEFNGVKINFTDTAGLRESGDEIEQEGIKRAKNAMLSADLVVYVQDSAESDVLKEPNIQGISESKVFYVLNKCDLTKKQSGKSECGGKTVYTLSAATGAGVDELLKGIVALFGNAENGEVMTSERHYFAVSRACAYLSDALKNYYDMPTDCILVDLRAARDALGEITGETLSDEIVNNIFDKFCVGK